MRSCRYFLAIDATDPLRPLCGEPLSPPPPITDDFGIEQKPVLSNILMRGPLFRVAAPKHISVQPQHRKKERPE